MKLATKFSLLATTLVITAVMAIGGFVAGQLRSESSLRIRQQGSELAAMTAHNGQYAVYTGNPAELERLLDSISENPDVTYATVFAADGIRLVSRSFREDREVPVFPLSTGGSADEKPRVYDARAEDRTVSELHVIAAVTSGAADLSGDPLDPLLGETMLGGATPNAVLGYVQLGLSDTRAQARLQQLILMILGFGFGLVVVGAGVAILAARRIGTASSSARDGSAPEGSTRSISTSAPASDGSVRRPKR